jgi:hypothetical protein
MMEATGSPGMSIPFTTLQGKVTIPALPIVPQLTEGLHALKQITQKIYSGFFFGLSWFHSTLEIN